MNILNESHPSSPPLCRKCSEHAMLYATTVDRISPLRRFSSDGRRAWTHGNCLAAWFSRFQRAASTAAVSYCQHWFCPRHIGKRFPGGPSTDDHCRWVMVKIIRLTVRQKGEKMENEMRISLIYCSLKASVYSFHDSERQKHSTSELLLKSASYPSFGVPSTTFSSLNLIQPNMIWILSSPHLASVNILLGTRRAQ